MAGAMAAWIMARATGKLSSLFSSPTTSQSEPNGESLEDLRRLERTMKRIRAVLRDADEREIHDHSKKHWLRELEEVAYDADDVVDEYQYDVLRSELESRSFQLNDSDEITVPVASDKPASSHSKRKRDCGKQACNPSSGSVTVPVSKELAIRVRKIIDSFDEITNDWDKLRLKKSDGKRRHNHDREKRQLIDCMVDECQIHGREKEKEDVVDMLLSENCCRVEGAVSVLVITGLGGIGKTTLAQLAYNDPRITAGSFDLMGRVGVSMDFDVEKLTQNILTAFTEKKCAPTGLVNLQRKLMKVVNGKRFLLVLDDVWNESYNLWQELQKPLKHALSGTVLVTACNNEVARMMQTVRAYPLSTLPSEDCRSLFMQIVFGNQDPNGFANLLEFGEGIVGKCGGLPLAVSALAHALRGEIDENKWIDVLESELWDIKTGRNEVLPALKISYDQMPTYLKPCFIIFALFPKNYVFIKDNILKLWMSLGFLKLDGRKHPEQIGTNYLDDLLQRTMIQRAPYSKRLEGFIVHDLLHDLAHFMAGEYFSSVDPEILRDVSSNVRYLSMFGIYQLS